MITRALINKDKLNVSRRAVSKQRNSLAAIVMRCESPEWPYFTAPL